MPLNKRTFKPGDTYHILNGPVHTNKIHVLTVVDDEYVVFKWYGRYKQWWHYQVEHEELLDIKTRRAEEWKKKNKEAK